MWEHDMVFNAFFCCVIAYLKGFCCLCYYQQDILVKDFLLMFSNKK
ncbi:hypothetical protein Sez_1787 [Streptococcus equi subsp. zooepidemicus MGCS10565]|uniref:Uncharacterized protein n=1 Tax=Streptococcus equi subsp. zooepidemicus (strain MGCS10565) TaxID=552526 RepID=B4U5A3_STREM|nr:hypothetical protein Sez_1787 [Streptococcus equi subsp. zooepidemicus MGCS10565]